MANVLEPFFNGKKCATSSSTNLKGLTVFENKDEWKDIVKEANLIKRLNVKEIKVALDQLRKLVTNTTVIDYHQTTGVLKNSSEKIASNVSYYLVNDLTLNKLSNEIARNVSYGKRVVFVINSINESNLIVQQLKTLVQSFQDGLFSLIIKNGLKLDSIVQKLNSVDRNLNSLPVFVVFKDSDYISAIESLPVQLNSKNYKNTLFLVQESQIKVVKEVLDRMWTKIKPKNEKYCYELVNYDLNTILDNNQDPNIESNKINLLAFRDKFDVVKLLNHCPDVTFVSIWHKNTSTCSYIAENVKTSNLFWFNSVANYSPNIPLLNSESNELLPKDLFFDDSLNLKNEELKNFKLLGDYLSKKPNKLSSFQLVDLIVACLQSFTFPNESDVLKYLKEFYGNLTNSYETKNGTYTTKHYPVGFVYLLVDAGDNQLELLNLILSCILSNNVVYLSINNDLGFVATIKQFVKAIIQYDSYFKNMIILDEANIFEDRKLKSLIKHNDKHLGTYITYSQQKHADFRSLEHKLFTCKTVFKPNDVFDNTN